MFDLIVRDATIVRADGPAERADIAVKDGKVAALLKPRASLKAAETINATGKLVLPGVVDLHTHVQFARGLAGWRTETACAAQGGVTTIFNFLPASADGYLPLIAETKRVAAEVASVDFGLHVICCSEVHLTELPLYRDVGVSCAKAFMTYRGEEGRARGVVGTDDGYLTAYFAAAAHAGMPAAVHAENIEVIWRLRGQLQRAGREDVAAWSESRPAFTEGEAVARALRLSAPARGTVYFVHTSTFEALQEIRHWRCSKRSAQVHVETCPHYLTHSVSAVQKWGVVGKVNPPLRGEGDVEAMWSGVSDGTIDSVGTDHCPHLLADKSAGSIWTVGGGFPGLGTILPVLVTEGHVKRGIPLSQIVALLSKRPAMLAGCYPKKGSLSVGSDADLVVIDLSRWMAVDGRSVGGAAGYSLYDGAQLTGWPDLTVVRGRAVSVMGELQNGYGWGRYVSADRTV